MLAYAASRPTPVERRPYPNALLVIIALHVAGLAAVMSAKMDIKRVLPVTPIDIFAVPEPDDPPPPAEPFRTPPQPQKAPVTVTQPERQIEIALPQNPVVPSGGTVSPPTREIALSLPPYRPPVPKIVKLGPSLLTSGDDLKPPYPSSKLISEEEASLTLRLTIDERGRVVAVEPVGRTDRVFLEAARRHLIAHWRYRPASEDGRPKASSALITLRFQLDG